MTGRTLALIFLLAALAFTARADGIGGAVGPTEGLGSGIGGQSGIAVGSGGGGPPPAGCSNSLDFSKACNSQYIGAIL